MDISFHFPSLPIPRLTDAMLQQPLKILKEISDCNRIRFEGGYETKFFKNRKEELIQKLKNRNNTNQSFEKATDVSYRERLLLSIYLYHLSLQGRQNWLPDFDNTIAMSILGNDGRKWRSGRRRQASLLFFSHFDNVTALPFLCDRLIESYSDNVFNEFEKTRPWHEGRKLIFNSNGPENVASQLRNEENIQSLMSRYAIPDKGRFAEKLRQYSLLNKVKKAPLGVASSIFEQIENLKDQRVSNGLLLGAAALQILIHRVIHESRGKWPGEWSAWITRLGCDPRHSRSSAMMSKWWNWATDHELKLAQQGVTGLTLRFFIEFLKSSLANTPNAKQFALRSRFLLGLDEADKIIDARMVLNSNAFYELPSQYREPRTVAKLRGANDHTSIICLRCKDDLFIIQGTHNFRLRLFHRQFPISSFWDSPSEYYQNKALRVSPSNCPVSLVNDSSGNWVNKFFNEIREKFHIEWNDVTI
jgi:hypothetical protein